MLSQENLQEIKQRFGIVGNAEGLNRAIDRAYRIAHTDYSLLVVGESGVGKEFFPKIIHQYSARKHAKYLAVNCGAIPSGTIDSELFGHVKGAFTSAVADHKGYFEEADGGTIFLDEVGELPLETQVRLLRVLETGEFIRVGSSEVRKTNVRVVAATNVNLQQAIDNGYFRDDLYYRLSGFSIDVPALRNRKEDIPILFRKFAVDCTTRYQMPPIRLTEDAKLMLMNYYFRGNIRQLKNIAEQICVLEQHRDITPSILQNYLPKGEEHREIVRAGHNDQYASEREILYKVLFEMKHEIDQLKQAVAELQGTGASEPKNYSPQHHVLPNATETPDEWETVEEVKNEDTISTRLDGNDREKIEQALLRNDGNRKVASDELGISERTLYRKIKEYGLQPKKNK